MATTVRIVDVSTATSNRTLLPARATMARGVLVATTGRRKRTCRNARHGAYVPLAASRRGVRTANPVGAPPCHTHVRARTRVVRHLRKTRASGRYSIGALRQSTFFLRLSRCIPLLRKSSPIPRTLSACTSVVQRTTWPLRRRTRRRCVRLIYALAAASCTRSELSARAGKFQPRDFSLPRLARLSSAARVHAYARRFALLYLCVLARSSWRFNSPPSKTLRISARGGLCNYAKYTARVSATGYCPPPCEAPFSAYTFALKRGF